MMIRLKPISLKRVRYRRGWLVFRRSLVIKPAYNERHGFYTGDDQSLGIFTYAKTRTALVGDIKDGCASLWTRLVHAKDRDLTDEALAMKRRWLKLVIPTSEAELLNMLPLEPARTRQDYNRLRDMADRLVVKKLSKGQHHYLDQLLEHMGEYELKHEPIDP